jgi:hypothetical protein
MIIAVYRHNANKEPLCPDCQGFKDWRKRVTDLKRVQHRAPHGTWGAYQRHHRDNELVCDVCREFIRSINPPRPPREKKSKLPVHEPRARRRALKLANEIPGLARLAQPKKWKTGDERVHTKKVRGVIDAKVEE